MNYGLFYKGSKSRIAKWVVEALPYADVVDYINKTVLFCGNMGASLKQEGIWISKN